MALNTFLVAVIAACCFWGSSATLLNIKNQCPYAVTAFSRHGNSTTKSYNLAATTGVKQLDVGTNYLVGLIWASKTGNTNNAEATQLEISIDPKANHDTYDISLVNAYNLPASIHPIDIDQATRAPGTRCGTPTCTIKNLQSFCQPPNKYSGGFCINTDGLKSPTSGTRAFKAACPDAYSYHSNDPSSTYTCSHGTNYDFIFCP